MLPSDNSYWDIDDILAEEEPVTVRMATDVPGFGHLHAATTEEDLKTGQKVVIPYWLAKLMDDTNRGDLELPRHYSEQFKNALTADATIINLFEKSEFYYELGAKLAKDKFPAISETLRDAFVTRFKYILDQTSESIDHKILKKLANLERTVYESGRKGHQEQHEWKSGQLARIAQGSSMEKAKKRMRLGT